eukprot:TRINITY_DN15746_c0_g3_i1.p1 TRINITY_DN15746_c0_g3~~TRINITY_DN15746_c0_g3_i1.p1  ORF type:complete len:758 (+),score=191.18 TRINITY_DN15746_c0_g3_i1:71-2275(+)
MLWLPSSLALVAAASVTRAQEHPVEKTITLLKDLSAKAKEQGEIEEVTYAKFETWCSTSSKTLETAIAKGKSNIEVLEQTVKAKQEEESSLTKQIDSLGGEITRGQAAQTKAKDARDAEAALYTTSDKELSDTIDAINQAITALEAANKGAASFSQAAVSRVARSPLVIEHLSLAQHSSLLGLVGAAPSPASPSYEDVFAKGDLAAHTKKYNFKSGNVVELLKELKKKFQDDQLEGTKAETNAQNAHSLSSAALANSISAAESARTEKTSLLGDVQSALATANSSLLSAREDLDADSSNLDATKKSCTIKQSEWHERSEIRANEQKAIEAAIGILAKVAGVRTEAPANPVLPPSPLAASENANGGAAASLVQGHSGSPGSFLQGAESDPKLRAVNLLRQEAHKTHSHALKQFAEQVAQRLSGHFDEVNNMIQKMIFRLMAEQKDEDDHKNWCDLEMGKTNASQMEKTEKINALTLKIDEATASVQQMANDIKDANDMVAKLEAHIAEATEIREAGKHENSLAVKDAKSAQAGIAKAIAVLEAHYKESGMMTKEAYEFVQAPVELPENPSTWDSAYTGVADPANQPNGVVTILKQIGSDFAKMEADTLAQEEMDQKAYDDEKKSCEIEKARRAKEGEMKEQERKRLLDKVGSMEKSKKGVQNELEAANQYWKDLGPACMEGDSTYEERKAKRAEEVSALKEAQVILADAFRGGEASGDAAGGSFVRVPVQRRLVR